MNDTPPALSLAAEVTRAGVRRVLWLTLLLNVGVSLGKIVVGRMTRSMAMEADGFHSLCLLYTSDAADE